MIEKFKTHELLNEKTLFTDIKKELSSLKTEILEQGIEKRKEGFADYLKKGINTNEFPKASGLGKFLRTFRYYKNIKDIATEKNIPLNYFFGLKMIEGEGDPSAINTLDGGAGISQIQPDTFKQFGKDNLKKNYKIFSDHLDYKKFNYNTLTKKQGKSREEANKIIANQLMKIKQKGGYPALIELDDRFNPNIALDFSAEYLLHCKKYVNTKSFTHTSRDVYKNDKNFDFEWMLAFNGYNKGPKRFDVDVLGNHLQNLKTRIKQYNLYSQRLTTLLKKGYTYEEIVLNIKKKEKYWKKNQKKEEINQDTFSKFKNPEKKEEIINFTFLNKSQDKLWNVYKFTLSQDINSLAYINHLYHFLPKKELQFTDSSGKQLQAKELLSFKKGDILYIKEKI